jgi:glycyl-tRNA synthetase beta chain
METNQKFFPVLDAGGKLTEHFIGIANIESQDASEIRKGYERVIRPRFADAKFFFDEDLKQGLASMGDGLKTVTYQAKLGSVADKVARVPRWPRPSRRRSAWIRTGAPRRRAGQERPAEPHGQRVPGTAGHRRPLLRAARGRTVRGRAGHRRGLPAALRRRRHRAVRRGKVLAIAERLDTLAGGFAAGLKPTGNKDPFALRRNALGLARTIIESGFFDLDLNGSCSKAKANDFCFRDVKKLRTALMRTAKNVQADAVELYDFILDRLRGYYTDKGVPTSHFNAVAELKPKSLYDFDRRIDAIGTFAQLPEAEALAAANKRIGNILKKVDGEIPNIEDHTLLREPAELALAEAVEAVHGETGHALAHGDYVDVLVHLARCARRWTRSSTT